MGRWAGGNSAGFHTQLGCHTVAFTRLTRFLPGADTSPLGATVHGFPGAVFIVRGRLHDEAFGLWLEAGQPGVGSLSGSWPAA